MPVSIAEKSLNLVGIEKNQRTQGSSQVENQVALLGAGRDAASKYAEELKRQTNEINAALSDFFSEMDTYSARYADSGFVNEDQYKQISQSVKSYSDQLKVTIQNEQDAADSRRKNNAEQIQQMEDAAAKSFELAGSLDDFYSGLDEKSSMMLHQTTSATEYASATMIATWQSVGDQAASSFADMVVDCEGSIGDLTRIVARAVVEMAAKILIIGPLINGIFGLSGTSAMPALWSISGARAGGGDVSGGETYLVGEDGPELFTPRTSGHITPNEKLASVTSGGGGNTIINADLRGASVDAVARLERYVASIDATLERRAVGAVVAGRRSGGGMSRALGA